MNRFRFLLLGFSLILLGLTACNSAALKVANPDAVMTVAEGMTNSPVSATPLSAATLHVLQTAASSAVCFTPANDQIVDQKCGAALKSTVIKVGFSGESNTSTNINLYVTGGGEREQLISVPTHPGKATNFYLAILPGRDLKFEASLGKDDPQVLDLQLVTSETTDALEVYSAVLNN